MEPRIINGCPRDKWEEVQAVQHAPFIFIQSNGSRWAGEEAGDVDELLNMLANYKLDIERFGTFITVNPCRGVQNPKWNIGDEETPRWIDGERLYNEDGVVAFFGNFENYSHCFGIHTNHKPTIEALTAAIELNIEKGGK
jgi:hypothetical protein